MVTLRTTPAILSAISSLPQPASQFDAQSKADQGAPSTPSLLLSLPRSLDEPISHSSLIELSQSLLATFPSRSSKHTLDSLLRGTSVYHPPPPPKPQPTAEYLALKAKLLKEQEEREYNRLLQKSQQGTLNDENEDDISPSLVLNILLSVLLCGFAAFWATRFWSNQGLRVLLSMAVALIVGVAEVVVYAAYLRKATDARAKEARKKERKVAVHARPLNASIQPRADGVEKDVIWGRGVNGGMRRRVQERWEKLQHEN